MTNLLETALAFLEARQPVIAVRSNKKPYREGWNKYFMQPQTEDDIVAEFSNGAWGIARVLYPACELVHLDFDGVHAQSAMDATGIELPVTARQTTMSGGKHLV